MELNRGMQLAIQAIIKMIGLDPVKVQSSIEGIGKSVDNAASRLANLERQQQAIMAHLGIIDPVSQHLEPEQHAEQPEQRKLNGGGAQPGTIRTDIDVGAGN